MIFALLEVPSPFEVIAIRRATNILISADTRFASNGNDDGAHCRPILICRRAVVAARSTTMMMSANTLAVRLIKRRARVCGTMSIVGGGGGTPAASFGSS